MGLKRYCRGCYVWFNAPSRATKLCKNCWRKKYETRNYEQKIRYQKPQQPKYWYCAIESKSKRFKGFLKGKEPEIIKTKIKNSGFMQFGDIFRV